MSASHLHSWTCPVVINDLIVLSGASPRFDILAPILNLRGRLEDLVLDLHYSYLRPRVWNCEECKVAATEIFRLLNDRIILVAKEVAERCPQMSNCSEGVVDAWLADLEKICSASGVFEMIRFTRPC